MNFFPPYCTIPSPLLYIVQCTVYNVLYNRGEGIVQYTQYTDDTPEELNVLIVKEMFR